MPSLLDLYASLDPENTGGAMLLGVDGVCIISHGSSSAVAMVNAIRVARDMVTSDVVGHLSRAVRPPAASHPPIVYPIAVLTQGKHTDAAKRFVEHTRTESAQAIFREAGFAPPP